jgi:hypothetical protein
VAVTLMDLLMVYTLVYVLYGNVQADEVQAPASRYMG